MANPVVNNNGGAALTANGTYCSIQVPGFIQGIPATCVQPQFWEASYFCQAGSTGVGTVITFQSEANDGTWSNLSAPAPITVASGTTYNSTIQAPCGGLRLVVSGLVGNGIAYAQLAGIEVPTVSGGGQATTQSPKTPQTIPSVVQTPKSTLGAASAASVAVAFTNAVAAGNTLIALVDWGDQTSVISSVHDSLNAANWTRAGTLQQGQGVSAGIYYLGTTLGGACTVTLTMVAAAAFPEIAVIEVAGLSGAVDVTSGNTGTTLAADPGALTTTAANDFIISGCVVSTSVTLGAGGNWIFTVLPTSGTGFEYLNAGAAASYDGTFTCSSPPSWGCAQAAFKSK